MRTRHRTAVSVVAAVLALGAAAPLLTAAPAAAVTQERHDSDRYRGTLLDHERLYSLGDADDAAAELTAAGFDGGVARYGVDAYRLEYRTVDAYGRPTVASGLLAVPRGRHGALTAVSFTHGTGVSREDAPSMLRGDFVSASTISYAAAGFAGVAPDYLGMGTGPGFHPWMDVPSETTATIDMLRAAREFLRHTGHPLRRDVMVTGFSQGASAAIGVARALQAGEDRWFRAAALAPVSGAYAFRDAELPALFDGRVHPKYSVLYMAYLFVSLNRQHGGIYDDPAEIFREPYAATVETLYDGDHSGAEVMASTPDSLDELLTEAGMDLLRSPSGTFAELLAGTDAVCADWVPEMPMRLYQARGDEQAVTENTAACRADLAASGARVPVFDLGEVDYEGSRHLGSAAAAIRPTIAWFRSLS
ncbi:lipase [Streptomyces sp. RFCAC02]|uniref:lipase n=1 Tax=Streptomyces sp. RFCAC02 TaxID=2499143 RepID=UPI001020DAF7|nr:lipase [Streptomyces sp. RFCAC02]